MTKIAYIDQPNWNSKTKLLLDKITEIVEKYDSEGYRMTLRQLYYQLVSRDILPNEQKQYAKLSRILTEARMCGLVDWDFIEDRIRVPKFPNQFNDIDDAMRTITNVYRLDLERQGNYQVETVKPHMPRSTITKVLNAYSKFIDAVHNEGLTMDDFTNKEIRDDIFERLNK